MDERDPILERAIETLREPVRLGSDLDRRVMQAVEAGGWWQRLRAWLSRGRTLTVTPLRGLGFATALAALLVAEWVWLAPGSAPVRPATVNEAQVVQFVLVAPSASDVSLVGDFNGWNKTATPMRAEPQSGVWTTTVSLPPGRYHYAFVVNDTTWVRDPTAPPSVENDFGRPNSVVTVRGS